MSNSEILILGDFHLRKTKLLITERLLTQPLNSMKWVCSNWASIKTAKKEYFKYKVKFGIPHIVVLSVGNNDLTKVSSEHCVLTSLLRTANTLRKDGVNAIVICSLVQQHFPTGSFNTRVKEINRVLRSRAKTTEWMFYFEFLDDKKHLAVGTFERNGHDLSSSIHVSISEYLEGLTSEEEIKTFLQKERGKILKRPSNLDSLKVPRMNAERPKSQKRILFQEEIKSLKFKLNLLSKEKAEMEECASEIKKQIVTMREYISRLERIAS